MDNVEARRTAQQSPADALALLDEAAAKIADPAVPEKVRNQLQQRIERARRDIEESTGKRRGELEMERKSAQVEARVTREKSQKVEVDQRLAMLLVRTLALGSTHPGGCRPWALVYMLGGKGWSYVGKTNLGRRHGMGPRGMEQRVSER